MTAPLWVFLMGKFKTGPLFALYIFHTCDWIKCLNNMHCKRFFFFF